MTRMRVRLTKLASLLAVLALATAGVLWWTFADDGDKRVTAYFTRTVGVYSGSDVRVLGVAVGEVESVTPQPEQVEVVLRVEHDAPIAADTGAVVVSPSVVADRYVQFTKLSGDGPRITDGTVISTEDTATPVELDELYRSLDDLAVALGPDGANADGALSELLETGEANLDGNGKAFNDTVRDFADLARTLSGSQDDLFGTVEELQTFTSMLAGNDEQVETVNRNLAAVSQTLADDREELSGALRTLGSVLADIQSFISTNRERIQSNVGKLSETTQLLVEHRASIAEALDIAPLAASNVLNTFDPESGTLQGRADILEYFLQPGSSGGGSSSAAVPLPLPVTGSTTTGSATTASEGGS